jgi:hypothetical protein
MNSTQGQPQSKDPSKSKKSLKRKENTSYWNDLQFEQMLSAKKAKK